MVRSGKIAFGAILLACWGALPALAQEAGRQQPVIMVTGEGEASIAPDMAVLQLGVVSEGKTAADALAANNQAMAKVLQALKAGGLAERDVQTVGFDISPRYRQPEEGKVKPQAPLIDGYTVSNGLTVRVRDLSKLGTVIDDSVKLGVNQGGSVTFTNDKPEEALTEARKAAMLDAMARAKTLTEAAGVKLGPILSISENSVRPMERAMMLKASARDMPAPAVPMAAGENNYHVTVNVTFALGQ
ncbi:SIMPL domain-containing protein [Rhizobium paknamense]|uniref:Uncharacterized protein YggE n=1 Tax=Rhizobium paknamense TaxID=1206817 RepID=A0ABU0IB65_9HYPH|nr:SIMPL domain-containing protein [Rhizobium paknamense]MDQ0454730.1 uncharacterized protein YggE [Rhizobium paknamense]